MTDTKPSKIWWTYPTVATGRNGIQIKPYFADVTVENSMSEQMAELKSRVSHSLIRAPFDEISRPDELRWFYSKVPEKSRNLPDAFKGFMDSIIVSEAMRDVLSDFDLGSSQIFELPLYELSVMTKSGDTESDHSKPDPRRWFLLHIVDFKSSLVIEKSENLLPRPIHDGEIYRVCRDKEPVIAVDSQIATTGSHIWLDQKLRGITFFSDPLKRAIKAAKLRTPILKFKPCLVVSRPEVHTPSEPPSVTPKATPFWGRLFGKNTASS